MCSLSKNPKALINGSELPPCNTVLSQPLHSLVKYDRIDGHFPIQKTGTAESHFVCGRPHTKKRVDNYRDPKPSVNYLWPSAIQAVTRLVPGPSFISTCLSYVWQNAWVSQAIIQGLFLSLWSLCLLQLWKTGAQNGNGNNSELLRVYSI